MAHPFTSQPFGQSCCPGCGHVPAPSQNATSDARPPEHPAGLHTMPSPGYVQVLPFLPSHAPAQVLSVALVPLHAGRGETGAVVTGVQVPSLPATLHASHWPEQSLLQQT